MKSKKLTNEFICGDALVELRKMPDNTIDMCITSPPYYGLRDYGIEQIFEGDPSCEHKWDKKIKKWHGDRGTGPRKEVFDDSFQVNGTRDDSCIYCGAWQGQLGLEPNPEMYIEHLTEIFNEVKRVLKKEGTLWLNIGDTYHSPQAGNKTPSGISQSSRGHIKAGALHKRPRIDLPQKCLTMIPERLAWSLIQSGWILRNKIIWYKPNAMPSSVTDRFSNRWEYLFMFSRNQKYYFDLDAVREPHIWAESDKRSLLRRVKGKSGKITLGLYATDAVGYNPDGKNPGDVFEINTQPFPEAHFAVFPEKLCEKPIKAGCPKELCKKCGKAKERITEKEVEFTSGSGKAGNPPKGKHEHSVQSKSGSYDIKMGPQVSTKTIGWTSCKCNAGFEPGIILDPFAGAGTAGVMAKSLGRKFILIDIKKEYMKMAKRRVVQVGYQKELFEE